MSGTRQTVKSNAFEQGRKDARRGRSRLDVRYSDPDMAEAWTQGWDHEAALAAKAGRPVASERPKDNRRAN